MFFHFVNLVLSLPPVNGVPLDFACFSQSRLLLATSSPNVIFVYPACFSFTCEGVPCTKPLAAGDVLAKCDFLLSLPLHSIDTYGELTKLLLSANKWFFRSEIGRFGDTPCCFRTVWPVFSAVTPGLRGHIRHLTQQDIGDLLFSISREYARRLWGS
jgi:hypothetical protein